MVTVVEIACAEKDFGFGIDPEELSALSGAPLLVALCLCSILCTCGSVREGLSSSLHQNRLKQMSDRWHS